jgi:hypothetical protein
MSAFLRDGEVDRVACRGPVDRTDQDALIDIDIHIDIDGYEVLVPRVTPLTLVTALAMHCARASSKIRDPAGLVDVTFASGRRDSNEPMA